VGSTRTIKENMTDTVSYDIKYVRNLGNFESVHVGFGITSDVKPGESVEDAKKRVEAKVDTWLETKVNEIDADAAS
jgi:hypothetical protein